MWSEAVRLIIFVYIRFIAEQLKMKIMFMQGLKNILKGSLSNQILGDIGGFSYQGQNIYVKAVKCNFDL